MPSIHRSTRLSPFAFLIALTTAGCGITPDSIPAQHQAVHPAIARGTQPATRPSRPSRFADIDQAKFFEESKPVAAIPFAPPPAPAGSEWTALDPTPEPADAVAQLPACRPARGLIQQTQATDDYVSRPPVNDPRKLKKISEIQPFTSYEPDPLVRAKDPCRNLCPRPDGAPCKDGDDMSRVCPEEVVLSNEEYVPRCFEETVFAWEASNIYYNPLYFEDVALERYGHTYPCWIQPFASVGKFSVQLAGLPYQMGIDPVCKKIYPLGYYRPGECAPKLHYQVPFNTRAALLQAGVTTGLFFVIP